MKKRKFNLLLNIAVLCMCVCAIAIGVYSAKTASLNVSGTIGFNAHNCEIAINAKMEAYTKNADGTNTPVTKYFNSDNSPSGTAKQITGSNNVWDIGTVCFDDLNTDKYHEVNDVVFTFEITNMSAYYADVTVDQNCISDNRIFIYAPNNGETLAPKDQTGTSVTLTVKLQLQKVNGEYSSLNSAISLSNATLLNFTKSQAPSYLATNWRDKITDIITDIYSVKSISFVNKIDDIILKGFDINAGGTYKTVPLGAVNATSEQSDLTNNTSVTDVVAYYNSTDNKVIVYSPARIYAPQNCGKMFMFANDSDNTLTILDLSNFDTSKVKNMSYMFYGCFMVGSLDLSNFDTSEVTDMSYMFFGCGSGFSLDLSNFNTSSVTNMCNMFFGIFVSLDLSSFDTSNVIDMSFMFNSCTELTSLDLSNFNTSNVTDMSSMFANCWALTNLDVSNFDTSNVTRMNRMFYNNGNGSQLTSLDLSSFDTSNVTDMSFMFNTCSSLTSLDLSNFNTSKVTNMSYMFNFCSKLETIEVGSTWSIASLSTSASCKEGTFAGCTLLNQNSTVAMKYDSSKTTADYAITGTNGYLTLKSN